MGKIARHVKRLQHCRAARHGHHALYLAYYGLALLEDHGVKLAIVGGVMAFHVLAVLSGEE